MKTGNLIFDFYNLFNWSFPGPKGNNIDFFPLSCKKYVHIFPPICFNFLYSMDQICQKNLILKFCLLQEILEAVDA